jgi:hypothetical protein
MRDQDPLALSFIFATIVLIIILNAMLLDQ